MSFDGCETKGNKKDPSDHYWVETVEKAQEDVWTDSREPKAASASSTDTLADLVERNNTVIRMTRES